MFYRRINSTRDLQIKMGIAFLLVFIIVVALSANIAKLQSIASKTQNQLYMTILNNSIPIVKVSQLDIERISEEKFYIRDKLLEAIGINVYNPLSVIGREMALFKSIGYTINEGVKTNSRSFVFNPFNLSENSIFRNKISAGEEVGTPNLSQELSLDATNIPNQVVSVHEPSLKKTINLSKPEVFIYHTHTTESYRPGDAFKEDETKNVCAIGELLSHELQNNYGISVIHDKTNHSTMYAYSYNRSRETLDKYLKKYGNFKLIIDLHRDSVTSPNIVTTRMNGENVAKIMFAMTRKNPNFKNNQAVVNKLVGISDRLYPGFCRGIMYYESGTRYFNQDMSSNSVLIEVGADINALEEAKASAKYLARIIAEYINGK